MYRLIQSLLNFSLGGMLLLALAALISAAVAKKWYGFFRMLAALLGGICWGIIGTIVTAILCLAWNSVYWVWIFWGAWLLSDLGFPAAIAFGGFKQHQLIWAWAGICGIGSFFLLWTSLAFMIYLGQGV